MLEEHFSVPYLWKEKRGPASLGLACKTWRDLVVLAAWHWHVQVPTPQRGGVKTCNDGKALTA